MSFIRDRPFAKYLLSTYLLAQRLWHGAVSCIYHASESPLSMHHHQTGLLKHLSTVNCKHQYVTNPYYNNSHVRVKN